MKGQRVFRRITWAELGGWWSRHPGSLLLDARDPASHARDGWPGSICLTRDNQDELLLRTDRRRPVLIYCHHGRAGRVRRTGASPTLAISVMAHLTCYEPLPIRRPSMAMGGCAATD